MVMVASFNVENLFGRPKAFNTGSWAHGERIVSAYREFNTLIAAEGYSDASRDRMRRLLVDLGVYYENSHGAVRRRLTSSPAWAWLRKNRGSLYYLQVAEALGRPPEPTEFGAGRYEWDWAGDIDNGWPSYQRAIEQTRINHPG